MQILIFLALNEIENCNYFWFHDLNRNPYIIVLIYFFCCHFSKTWARLSIFELIQNINILYLKKLTYYVYECRVEIN